jgi:hypothetical protein
VNSVIPQIGQIEANKNQSLFIPQIRKNEAKRSLFIPQLRKIEAEQTWLIPEIGKIEAKNELDRSKTNRGGIFKTFMEPRNGFQGIDSASLCPGGPVQQPYSSSVPSPLRLL